LETSAETRGWERYDAGLRRADCAVIVSTLVRGQAALAVSDH